MPETTDRKVIVSVGLTPRTETAIAREAKRLGISFSDMMRRITDPWAEDWHDKQLRAKERAEKRSLYDHPSSHQPLARVAR